MKKKWLIAIWVGVIILAMSGYLFATSATYKQYILGKLLTVGDIFYADRSDRFTNLNAGATGTVLQSAGPATAPAYVAKNTFRRATVHNFATAAVSWQLSADELLCKYLAATNANGAATLRGAFADGQEYVFHNRSGQAIQVYGGTTGSGFSVTNAKVARFYWDGVLADVKKLCSEF